MLSIKRLLIYYLSYSSFLTINIIHIVYFFSEYGNIDIVTDIILSYQYEGKEIECLAVTKNYVIKNRSIGSELLKENGINTEGEEIK